MAQTVAQQPADTGTASPYAIPDAPAGELVVARPEGGFLSIRPDQNKLDPAQRETLSAMVGITIGNGDDKALAAVRMFVHVCQTRGLDPWANEIYLIKRGNGEYAKYTIQTGIDGYRKLAAGTGRQIGGAQWFWTGDDDDPSSWHTVIDDKTGRVKKLRIWQDEWPDSLGYPGAAMAEITHYDDHGNVVVTTAVAHWKMYAPFFDKKEWNPQTRKKETVYRKTTDDQGHEVTRAVQELSDKWKDGPAHMLGKCAEALALRKAFPARTSGIFTTEEMHRADAEAAQAASEAAAEDRRQAYLRAQQQNVPAAPPVTPAPDQPAPPSGGPHPEHSGTPRGAADPAGGDAPAEPGPPVAALTDEERLELLVAEVEEIALIRGETFTETAAPLARRLGKAQLAELTADELVQVIGPARPTIANLLRTQADQADDADTAQALHAAADTYLRAATPLEDGGYLVAPVEVLFGRPSAAATARRREYAAAHPGEVVDGEVIAPHEPHVFQDPDPGRADADPALCDLCGQDEDAPIHDGP